MKRLLLPLLLLLTAITATASEEPRWIRHTAISPDGTTIAFTYKGNIYTIPVTGGRATQITSHGANNAHPVWSPSGKQLAFASDRAGNFNVYITSAEGGEPTQLTYHSKAQVPVAFLNEEELLYEANILPHQNMGLFPSGTFTQLYKVSVNGGRATMYNPTAMKEPSIGKDGRVLYTDIKGYEDPLRKHHQSSIARDIWLWTPSPDGNGIGSYQKLTSFRGEDRTARWLPSQEEYLYTSEQDGTLNIYRGSLNGNAPVQLTTFSKHPVRFLSVSQTGDAAFSYDGELYYMPLGKAPQKLTVQIISDHYEPAVNYQTLRSGATSAALSPNEKEVAIVVRGDVFVTSVEYGTSRRITNTPEQERNVAFSPDGRKLVYSAERNGKWNLFMCELVREEDKQFLYAKELKETQLTDDALPSFQPVFSPDGKEIAFLRDRSAIFVLNLETKQERQVMEKKYNYSYSDGDQHFAWSSDGKWIITDYIGIGGWNNKDVALVKADGSGTTHNLTQSGYSEGSGRFVMDGKAVIFHSDMAGYRSHGSWGSEYDLYLMFLDQEAWDQFKLNKEDRAHFLATNEEESDKEGKKEEKVVEELQFNLQRLDQRTIRLTRSSGFQSDYVVNKKGDKLYYLAHFDNKNNLYALDLAEMETERLMEDVGFGQLQLGKDDTTLYFFGNNGFYKIEGSSKKPISTYAVKFQHQPAKEREYIFNHVVDQVENKFYDQNLHGVDWQGYAQHYRQYLPHINNNRDFAEMLSELLGELNASHTGARYYAPTNTPQVASLGLFYDDTHKGEGVKIAEVIAGGPMDRAKSIAAPGVLILKVNGEVIDANKPIEHYLLGKQNEWIMLTLRTPQGVEVEEHVRPISGSAEQELLYLRWVEQRADMVKEWSNGKIGYIHVRGMDSPSFRKTYKDLLGKYRHCDAVVIDTRFNGGGWLHEDLAILLSGKEYARFMPRGQYIGSDPFAQWFKPSAVLMSEGNYSNAHGFPWVYKTLGIGKLVGTPVPGTMTAVWWEKQIDPSIIFGIPQTTVTDVEGTPLENQELHPDILIYNTPEQNLQNQDAQLKAAVQSLLQQ